MASQSREACCRTRACDGVGRGAAVARHCAAWTISDGSNAAVCGRQGRRVTAWRRTYALNTVGGATVLLQATRWCSGSAPHDGRATRVESRPRVLDLIRPGCPAVRTATPRHESFPAPRPPQQAILTHIKRPGRCVRTATNAHSAPTHLSASSGVRTRSDTPPIAADAIVAALPRVRCARGARGQCDRTMGCAREPANEARSTRKVTTRVQSVRTGLRNHLSVYVLPNAAHL